MKIRWKTLKDTSLGRTGGSVTPKIRQLDKAQFELFVGKKVTISGEIEGLSGKRKYVKQGRFVKGSDKQIYFMEKGRRKKGKQVTAGLFEGFYATLTIRKVKPTW